MSKIFVTILTFNSEKTIEQLLETCLPLKSKFNFIVIDNKSTDSTVSKVKKYNFAKLIQNKKNLGFSAGNNIGIKYALKNGADVVFLLNPDTIIPADFLKRFNETTKELLVSSEVGILGPKIYDEKGKIWSVGGKIDKKRYSAYLVGFGSEDIGQYSVQSIDYISATAIFIKKEVFEKIGLLREDYFLYYEDVDFCFRARIGGFKLAIDSNISIIHHASSSVGKNSPVMQYYMARNHMLFVERFAPVNIKIRELIRLPKTLTAAKSKFELMGILDYCLRRFGNAYWG